MKLKKVEKNHILCAVVESREPVITDAHSAVELLMTARYEAGTKNLVLAKEQVAERFFILSSGLAGEVFFWLARRASERTGAGTGTVTGTGTDTAAGGAGEDRHEA